MASGATLDDPEIINYQVKKPGTYYLVVAGYSGAIHPTDSYLLDIALQ